MSIYGVLIQTEPGQQYRPLRGWDQPHNDRAAAESSAARARKLWHGAKVVKMTRDEAHAYGWIESA